MRSILGTHDCYGCGVCTIACSRRLIQMRLNENGFYEPYIENIDACTNCGMCLDVCAYAHEECANALAYPVDSYGAWSNTETVRRECSSGGIGYEIARTAMERGYKICAVKYNTETRRAEHYLASSIEDLAQSKGSKYIQSYTPTGLGDINRKEKTVVFGTPCQIDSMRRYVRKLKVEDNFILVDFFCHSVPSMYAWQKYLDALEIKTGKSQEVVWRDKETGWHDSYLMKITGSEKSFSSWGSKGDIFYRLFLGDYCCGKACQKSCKYKYNRSSADVRIGDAWGPAYKDNEKGVSAVIVFTSNGQEVMSWLQQNCTLEPQPFSVIAEGQMKHNVEQTWITPIVRNLLKTSLTPSLEDWTRLFLIHSLPLRIANKFKFISKRVCNHSKKSIGIMTMHKVLNSGSAIQAFALQKKLEQLGYESEIIDYIFPNAAHISMSKRQRLWAEYAPQWLQYLHKLRYLKTIPDDRARLIRFTDFYKRNLKLSQTYTSIESLEKNPPRYDLYMTGSDQVWNPKHVKNDGSFLFSFLKGKEPRVSYAASFTTSELPDEVFPKFAKLLPKYRDISVRELSGLRLAIKLGGRIPHLVCDPTLLLTKDDYHIIAEQSKFKPKGKYILAYILTYAYDPYPYIRNIIEDVKKQLGLPVIIIQSHHKEDEVDMIVNDEGPCEFLWLFEHAEFVITTSFHGTAFSLNFEKPFYSVVKSETSTDSRMVSLLQRVHRTDSILVYDKDRVGEIKHQQTSGNKYLEEFRHESIDILKAMVINNLK